MRPTSTYLSLIIWLAIVTLQIFTHAGEAFPIAVSALTLVPSADYTDAS
jgi:hypothetical protein